MNVSVNSPKTPVTKNSSGIAAATVPNVCKMPGPPAPFVPTPLPNIGKSGDSPKGYSTTVKIGGQPVAIKGASFGSTGDIASKGTGGGIVSSNTHGPTKFVGPGSMDVKIEGKNVHRLGDPMINNCGPSGNPANSATLAGVIQSPQLTQGGSNPLPIKCKDAPASSAEKLSECEKKEICAKCADINQQAKSGTLKRRSPEDQKLSRKAGNSAARKYRRRARKFLRKKVKTPDDFKNAFTHECQYKAWEEAGADQDFTGLSPDHIHEIQLGGHPTDPKNLRWMSSRANEWIGKTMSGFKTEGENAHTGVKPDCCD